MKLAIASDHAGYALKQNVKEYLRQQGHFVEDFGTHSSESMDYPDVARPAAESVARGDNELGILICGSGIGMSMAGNKVKGVRAALCSEPLSARLTKLHNDANILCLGARMIGIEMALEILEVFLNTKFEGGRHQRRVDKLEG